MRRLTAGLLLAAILAAGCSSGEVGKQGGGDLVNPDAQSSDSGEGQGASASPTADPSEAGSGPAFETEEPGQGTKRDRPLGIGTATEIDEWTVRVVAYDPDATQEILDFNGQNSPPPDGQVYAAARIEATWNGSGSKNAFLSLEWALVDDAGKRFTDEGCGVLPDDLASQSEVPSGSSANGTICFVTDTDALEEVVLHIAPLMGEPTTRRWWLAPAQGAGTVFAAPPAASSTP